MDILEYTFFQNALVILVLTSIVSGLIGSLIVIKKISMVSGSISHGAFGGLGAAYYFGLQPLLGALLFSSLGSFVISFVYRKYRNYLDTILTIFWAGGMAIGLIFVFITPGYATDLFSYLFGNVLLARSSDLYFILLISLIVLTSIVVLYKTLIAVLFNEEFAKLKGVNVSFVFTYFLLLISLSVVTLIKATGIVLTLAMFTISPAIAVQYVKKVYQIMALSVCINMVTTVSGLFISYYLDFPTAPSIILIQIVFFSISLFGKKNV